MSSVDIVVPCYNYGRYLETCVSSALTQRDVDVRVLIVDDVSPDNSAEIGQALAAGNARVFYKRNPVNLGLVGTANVGVMGWASAKYTMVLSADDALPPGALARATAVMDRHDDIGMAYGMALVIGDADGEYAANDRPAFDYRVVSGPQFLRRFTENKNGVASPSVVTRTRLQQEIGGYNPKFPHTCDVEMWLRFSTRGKIGVINAPQAYYRWHNSNMSANYINGPLNDLREQLETTIDVVSGWASHIDGSADWVAAMRARFVEEACWLAGLAFERGDEAAERACIGFAREHQPNLWRSKSWRVYQAKRAMGRAVASRLRARVRGDAPAAAPFKHGELFGWWPEVGEAGAMSAEQREVA